MHRVFLLRHKGKHLVQLVHSLLRQLFEILVFLWQLIVELSIHLLNCAPLHRVLGRDYIDIDRPQLRDIEYIQSLDVLRDCVDILDPFQLFHVLVILRAEILLDIRHDRFLLDPRRLEIVEFEVRVDVVHGRLADVHPRFAVENNRIVVIPAAAFVLENLEGVSEVGGALLADGREEVDVPGIGYLDSKVLDFLRFFLFLDLDVHFSWVFRTGKGLKCERKKKRS